MEKQKSKCHKCGHDVYEDMMTCPNCNVKNRNYTYFYLGQQAIKISKSSFVFLIAISFIFVMLFVILVTDTQSQIDKENESSQHIASSIIDYVKHICYLNQIDGIANAAPLYLDPAKHYTEGWNNEKVTQYLGIDLSNLGSEFEYIGEQNHTVTYRNDGTLVRDLMGFSYKYSGSEFTVAVSKLSLPYDCIYALEESKKTNVGTEKGSVEVLFAGAAGGENATENQTLIVADFELNGVNYRVKAENISLTSFYNFVRSILNK